MASSRRQAARLLLALLLIVLTTSACGRLGYDPTSSAAGDASPGDASTGSDGSVVPVACVDPGCDLWPQCGCDSGQKCDVDGVGTRSCNTAGLKLHAQACTGSGDCSAGTSCLQMSDWPAGVNTCFQFCDVDADCAALGRGAFCRLSASSGGQVVYSLCTLPCDVLVQTGCPTGTQCSVYNFGTIAGTNCTAPGMLGLGDTCAVHFDCGPSMLCVSSTCRKACIGGDSTPCQGATTCRGLGLISQGVEYGACL